MSNSQDASTQSSEYEFKSDELDAIGEVMNIGMGSAATSLSSMLDRQVVITTPKMNVKPMKDEDYAALEPAMVVKIEFVEGVFGTNIMVFRRRDMQIILNLLMGNDDIPDEDENFEFDDLSMSAACEVANQMMGAAATALSEVFSRSVNISTPEAFVSQKGESINKTVFGKSTVEDMVGVSFNLTINGVMNSNFISMLPTSFAKDIVTILMNANQAEAPSPAQSNSEQTASQQSSEQQQVAPQQPSEQQQAAPQQPSEQQQAVSQQPSEQQQAVSQQPSEQQQAVPQQPSEQQQAAPQQPPVQQQQAVSQQMPMQQQAVPQQMPMQQQAVPQQMPMQQQAVPQQMPMQQQAVPQQMPMQQGGYSYPQQQGPSFSGPMGGMISNQSPVGVKKAKFPDFSQQGNNNVAPLNSVNIEMLMNVPLEVSVEIGKTRRPIREIADFGQGTVIELDKQAGAPVDIIVNGQLLAHGDVVVIGDNFGVRITEIVGTKELMDSLSNL
ncbi:MAG: flagellar motor switch phosphatase FliY [Oscillospiraceae bacterium]|nr:flagellar motor switch phosphatase FliY [Oscillospiraceae bacterium]